MQFKSGRSDTCTQQRASPISIQINVWWGIECNFRLYMIYYFIWDLFHTKVIDEAMTELRK